MKAAVVSAAGQAPALADIAAPRPAGDEQLIRVRAAAVSHVAKARAAGAHYSADQRFPLGVGADGVGTLADGRRVYFALPRPPHGSMAEWTVADPGLCVPVPDGLDDATAAAIANPAMSSWAALTRRARLKPGETVLINGATGTSGRLAVQIARLLGAGRIVATGRNADALGELERLGAHQTIPLGDDAQRLERRFMQEVGRGVDIVIDYLWGRSAECLLIAAAKAGREGVPMRLVQVGSMSAPDITLPAAVLRASAIELTGSGNGSVAVPDLIETIAKVLGAAVSDGLRIDFTPVPFDRFDQAWPQDDSTRRSVFIMNGGKDAA
ncbi:quinone oxidoreductase family protein [Paracoccus shandongensis]|uniref:quinone oxidoreductase family protein n=1 Tax=Paracoccus shandongensis TaxID=2816048 RepID=UPI001A8EB0CE|nr:zinc-binding alcohol dehydrogenase family protein [Paracoccus shandongensis]